jgi:hypothetical protein
MTFRSVSLFDIFDENLLLVVENTGVGYECQGDFGGVLGSRRKLYEISERI